jgi:acetyl esterase/lipase
LGEKGEKGDDMRPLRRLVPVLAGLALVTTAAACDWAEGTRYVDEVFDEVDITTDIVYRSTTTWDGQPIDLRLDIHQPRGDTAGQRPAVMWMHGGGFTFGDKSFMSGYATDSAERGYVGVTIQYRLRDQASADAAWDAYDDAVAAVEWLKDHAAEYRIDPNAIIAGGHSAGAITALNLLYAPGSRPPDISPVAGGVALAGFTLAAISSGAPPAIMQHGTLDDVISIDLARTQCDQAKEAGDRCEFVEYGDADHMLPYTHTDAVQESVHHLVFDIVLWELGYRPEGVPAAA